MNGGLAAAVARAPTMTVIGTFLRHASIKHSGLSGHPIGGRWAPPDAYPVLYLGRPLVSVTVEAYRHLVDSVEGMTGDLVAPRHLLTCEVDVGNVIDLRAGETLELLGLAAADLSTEVGEYKACQQIGAKAHQLGRKGILAPSATNLGETLALFTQHLSAAEMPRLITRELWERLPADPRRLRLVEDRPASGRGA